MHHWLLVHVCTHTRTHTKAHTRTHTHAGTFPIDTTKTRLQVQGQVMDLSCSQLRYRGMVHAIFRIYQEEGLLALYSGYDGGGGRERLLDGIWKRSLTAVALCCV